jgi:hypothetical protein
LSLHSRGLTVGATRAGGGEAYLLCLGAHPIGDARVQLEELVLGASALRIGFLVVGRRAGAE